jgi:hypothetical protein
MAVDRNKEEAKTTNVVEFLAVPFSDAVIFNQVTPQRL